MTNHQLIDKFLEKKLTPKEKELFIHKYKTDDVFSEEVHKQIYFLAALKKAVDMEHIPSCEAEPVYDTAFISKALFDLPGVVRRWIMKKLEVPVLNWNNLSENSQNFIKSYFFPNPQFKPVVLGTSGSTVSKDCHNFIAKPNELHVFEQEKDSDVFFLVYLPCPDEKYIGTYVLSITDTKFNIIDKIEIEIDNSMLIQLFAEDIAEKGILKFKPFIHDLEPATYYWFVNKNKESIISPRRFFILSK